MKKGKKNKDMMKRLLSTILGLVMVITMFGALDSFASGSSTPTDLTSQVKFELVDFTIEKVNETTGNPELVKVIEKGVKIGDPDTVKVGNNAILGYQFEVPTKVKKGDYFNITFPYVNVLRGFYANRPLMNGGEQIGNFVIDGNGNLKVTFSVDAAYIYDGGLRFGAGFIKDSNNFTLTSPDGALVVNFPVIKRTEDESDKFYPGKHVKAPVQPKMNKWGSYQLESGYFIYSLVVNGEAKEQIYKANVSKTTKIDTKKDIIVIDELPEGMTFEDKKPPSDSGTPVDRKYLGVLINLETPAYANGVITKDDITNTAGLSVRFEKKDLGGNETRLYVGNPDSPVMSFTIDETGDSMTWEAFQTHIKSKGKRTVGIWKNKKMIANVGTLPYADVKYEDLFGGETTFKQRLQAEVAAKKITDEQRKRMEEAYIGQGIINFTFDYRGFIEGQSRDEYINTAVMTYNKGKVYPRSMRIPYSFADGWAKVGAFAGSMEVVKEWVGNHTATSVEVELSAVNNPSFEKKTAVLRAPDWKHTFTDLPQTVEGGKQAYYTVKETKVDDVEINKSNYKSIVTPATDAYKFIIKNIEKTNIKVKKVWQDASGQEITPPNHKITLNLYKKGSSVPIRYTERTLPISGNWELTYEGFEMTDELGNKIEYEVRESSMPDGFESKGAWQGDVYVITNKMKANPTREITVTKVWKDHSGKILSDSTLPSVEVSLVKEGTTEAVSGGTATLNSTNKWTHTFQNLPIFEGNQMISYKVKEITALTGYDAPKVEGNMDDGFEIINKQKAAKVKVTKKWKNPDGTDFSDKALPEVQIEVQKVSDSSKVDGATLTKYDGWGAEFVLPALEDTQKIIYKVKELLLSGYHALITNDSTDTDGNTFIITNTREKRDDITVTKKWYKAVGEELSGAELSLIPDTVTLHIHEKKSGKKVRDVELRKDENWTTTITNLPKYEADGTTLIEYEIDEDLVTGFTLEKKVSVPNGTNIATLSNFKTKSVKVTKEWQDSTGNKLEDTLANSLTATFEIHKKVGTSGTFVKDNTISAKSISGNNSVTFDGLPAVENGENLDYKAVEQTASTGYTVVEENPTHDAGGNVSFVNKKNSLPVRNIVVNKTWRKADGTFFDAAEMAKLPEVEIKLYNRKDESNPLYTEKLTNANSWQQSFTVNQNGDDGNPIVYVVKETPVSGYTSDHLEYEVPNTNTVTFTNTQEKIDSILVEKKWKKTNNTDYTPEELKTLPAVTVKLYEEKDKTKILETKTISNTINWATNFTNLPKYDITGKILNVYMVEEGPVSGYLDAEYDYSTSGKIVLTNKKNTPPSGGIFIPPTEIITPPKDTDKEEPKKPEEPKTEDSDKPEPPKPEPPSSVEEIPGTPPTPPVLIPDIPVFVTEEEEANTPPPSNPITEIEEDEIPLAPPTPPTLPTITEEIPEIELDGDDVPLGNTKLEKKELAKSGGLLTYFVPATLVLAFLILTYFLVLKLGKKRENE